MNKTKAIILIILMCTTLLSCTSIKEGLSSSKNNTDEFLIEKKAPLVMPPDFNELPIPSNSSIENNEEGSVKNLINKSGNENSKRSLIQFVRTFTYNHPTQSAYHYYACKLPV